MYERGDMARERISDMLRDADAYRLMRTTRRGRTGQRAGGLRRIAAAAASTLLWPFRH
jgi:hypothetical protein